MRFLFFLVVTLLVTPSHSFSESLFAQRSSLAHRGVPAPVSVWKNVHRRSDRSRQTYHRMLPSIPSIPTALQNPAFIISIHFLLSNIAYLLRRSHLRGMSKIKLLQIRLTREVGVGLPLHATNIIVWQLFVTLIFPFLEPLSRFFGYVSFYYFYPNASGLGQ